MAEDRRRTRLAVTVALCALLVLAGTAVWYAGRAVVAGSEWAADNFGYPDPDVSEAVASLELNADSFAGLLAGSARLSYPAPEQVRLAALASNVAVMAIGSAPDILRVWAAALDRPSRPGSRRPDVQVCFSVTVSHPGAEDAAAEVTWPDGGCADPALPETLAYASRLLDSGEPMPLLDKLDDDTRAVTESAARTQLADSVGRVQAGMSVATLDRVLGRLIAVHRYETNADGLTLHVVVEVPAGGWATAGTPVLACFVVPPSRAIDVEPCGYPLVP